MTQMAVASLMERWGLEVLTKELVRDVYRVHTPAGDFCLKKVKEKPAKLQFIAEVHRQLKQKQFTRMAGFIPTLDGEKYLDLGGEKYILTPWLSGEEPSYLNSRQMAAAARALAEFHQATADLTLNANEGAKIKLDKWEKKLKRQLIELVDFCSQAESSSRPDEFDLLLREHGSWLGQQALAACQLLTASPYSVLVQQYQGKLPICHGDTAARNFLIDSQGAAWMIDFDSMAVDLPVVDLWRLVRRTLRKNEWKVESAENILLAYRQVRPLTREELQVLHAFLHFPERPWRMAKRYYNLNYPSTERAAIPQRVVEYLVPWREKSKFLREFAARYAL